MASDEPNRARDTFQDLRYVVYSIGGATLTTLVVSGWYAYACQQPSCAAVILWAIAIWCAAVGVGFLFGIPKVLQSTQPQAAATKDGTTGAPAAAGASPSDPASAARYQQRVNTNLEEISDWLTKIIVGLSLVQLKSLPPQINALADQITQSTPAADHRGFGIAIIVAFSVLGFLFGYLVTRLYIQGALFRAERALADPSEFERVKQIAQTSSTLLEQAMQQIATQPVAGPPAPAVQDRLKTLSDAYMNIGISDWGDRVRAKDQAAADLFLTAARSGVSKDWLADQTSEPLILALAAWVQAQSEPADAARLLKAGQNVTRKHVQYWIVQALGRLAERNMMTPAERSSAADLLAKYAKTADASLLRLIESVRKQL